jgi:hypothetical protein
MLIRKCQICISLLLCIEGCTIKNDSNPSIIENDRLLEILSYNFILEKKNEDMLISGDVNPLSEHGDTLKWEALLNTPKLVLRYDERHCDECLLNVFEKLDSHNLLNTNLLVLATHRDQKSLKIFKSTHRINIPIYRIPRESLEIPIEQNNTIYLFIMDKDKYVKLLFVPEKFYPSLIDEYLNIINDRFFKPVQIYSSSYMYVEKIRYEFGQIQKEEKAIAAFELYNTGSAPLIIEEIETTCGCTIPLWDKNPVKAGASTIVKVEYNTNKTGRFAKKVFVHSNAENSPLCLTISGVVNTD